MTTNAPSQNSDNQKVSGVDVNAVRPELIKSALDEVGLDSKKLVTDLVADLVSYYRGNYPDSELYECDTCGGLSVDADDVCPFCGDADIEPNEGAVTVVRVDAEQQQDPAVLALREKFTEKDLDSKIDSIKASMQAFAECSWELGSKIKDLHDVDMYKVRLDDEGKTAYKNFKEFCNAELGMSHTWAYNLMDVVANFDQGVARQVGPEKLKLLLKAPEDNREQLLEDVRNGMTKRELQRKIRETARPAATPTPVNDRYITAVFKPCKELAIPMCKSLDDGSSEPVRDIADLPLAEFEFDSINGVRLSGRFEMDAANSELSLVLTISK